jgi:hypothetical protein
MIIKFNKFRLNESSSYAEELVEYLSDDLIESYYKENLAYTDIDDILSIIDIDTIWRHFDDNAFVESWIDGEKDSMEKDDFSDYDFKKYLKQVTLEDDTEQKVIDFYKENNDTEDIKSEVDGVVSSIVKTKDGGRVVKIKTESGDIDNYNVENDEYIIIVKKGQTVNDDDVLAKIDVDYDDYLLDELDEDQLWEIIEEHDEDDFKDTIIRNRYEGQSAEDILSEFGYLELPDSHSYYGRSQKSYHSVAAMVYDKWGQYIDDDGIIDEWNDNEDIDYKKEQVQSYIYDVPDLQRDILSEETVLRLAELFEEESGNNIGDEYEFQKLYIEEYAKENEDDGDRYADAILYLAENFNLNDKISQEYPNHLWKKEAEQEWNL